MVKIRLKRFGAAKRPCYRVVVQDSQKPRDGVCIEEIGTFMPIAQEKDQVSIDMVLSTGSVLVHSLQTSLRS